MAWKRLLTEDDFGGFANPSSTIGGAAVNGSATTAMRSDAAPALGPLTRDLDFGGFDAVNVPEPTAAAQVPQHRSPRGRSCLNCGPRVGPDRRPGTMAGRRTDQASVGRAA